VNCNVCAQPRSKMAVFFPQMLERHDRCRRAPPNKWRCTPTHKVTQSQRSNCPVLGLPPDKFWIARHSARNSDLHLKSSSAYSPGPAKQQASCLAFTNSFDTQGPPTGCDSPSSVASGRNRENSVPLRVAHLDQTYGPNEFSIKTCLVDRLITTENDPPGRTI
jgi:hypothetical protein